MGSCGKNCYKKKLVDLDDIMKLNLPSLLLNFLFNLTKCSNSNSLRNALANWNAYSIYIASQVRNDYKKVATSGSRFDTSDALNFSEDDLNRWTEDFNSLICNGGGGNIIDLDIKYNGNGSNSKPLWPSDMTDEQKEAIKDNLGKNNNQTDSNISNGGSSSDGSSGWNHDFDNGSGTDGNSGSNQGNNGGNSNSSNGGGIGNNTTIIDRDNYNPTDGSNTNIKDDLDNTGNPIINIPVEELDDLNGNNSKIFTCFEFDFKLSNYIYINTNVKPMITTAKVENLKRLHYDILTPIYNYYFGSNTKPSCQLKITFGLGSMTDTIQIPAGSTFSKHIQGMAVDFTISGISAKQFIDDVKANKIPIEFGVLSPTNNLHITLPYTFEGHDVKNVIIESPYKRNTSLEIQFF